MIPMLPSLPLLTEINTVAHPSTDDAVTIGNVIRLSTRIAMFHPIQRRNVVM